MTQEKPTTSFGGAHIDPTLSPAAAKYAQEMAARKAQAAPPKYEEQVAGGPTPAIPRFDMPYEGPPATMQQVAEAQRRESIVGQPPVPQPQAQAPGLLPHDILPPEAAADPNFLQGQGSMYANAQPSMAYKYGVIRNGQRLAPQQLAQQQGPRPSGGAPSAAGGLRRPASEMAADIARVAELAKAQQAAEDSPYVQASADSAAGGAAAIGGGPRDGKTAEREMTPEEMRRRVNEMDDFDLNSLQEMMTRDILNNEEQRRTIEARLQPLDLGTLIIDGYVRQRVPIILPDGDSRGFVPEYESLSADVDLALKRLIVGESKTLKVDDRYLLDKYSLMGVAASLYSVNGTPFPAFRDAEGNFNDELFWKRFNKVVRLPIPMLASIGVNYFWFDIRVRKLFVAKNIKNG
jgi:hypothetical protein